MARTHASRARQSFPAIIVNATNPAPLFRQLYDGLAEAIRLGQFPAGSKLPSTRALAQHLRVSRNTVHLAFEQLIAEGYLEGKIGAGTYVAQTLPEHLLQFAERPGAGSVRSGKTRPLSKRTATLLKVYPREPWAGRSNRKIFPVIPALADFPRAIWQRLLVKSWRDGGDELLDYGWGHSGLRQAIAEYLGTARGVRCTADNVIVVAGAQQGIDLAIRVLVDEGQKAWIEDPGYPTAYGALISAGATPVPVPVDDEGLNVESGKRLAPDARLAYVTPSHQFPMGVTMSLRRRLELLDWAAQARAWIIEDDYSSEYRYAGRPLAALQGLDRDQRVIYLGTFSKVMFPALRLAYLIVPRDLIPAFLVTRFFASRHPPRLEQATLARFIAEGHFARHVRRMRSLYARRQAALVAASQRQLAGLIDVQPAEAGLHLLGHLPRGVSDRRLSQKLADAGIDAPALSSFAIKRKLPPALILGYSGAGERTLKQGVVKLREAVAGLVKP
ncbi:MAG: GntR family transcriptional regulator [Proteobacteria bacterium SG_bin9]|nr:MAG: GntR family transcriptional regulator [Proteobacteria bacterium SG_bin9]